MISRDKAFEMSNISANSLTIKSQAILEDEWDNVYAPKIEEKIINATARGEYEITYHLGAMWGELKQKINYRFMPSITNLFDFVKTKLEFYGYEVDGLKISTIVISWR